MSAVEHEVIHQAVGTIEVLPPSVSQAAALAVAPPSAPMTTIEASPLAILSAAVQRGASVDELRQLVELADRVRAEQARVALDEALADFQASLKPIPRNREAIVSKGGQESYRYRYSDLAQINKSIKPALKRAGIAVTYDAKFEGSLVTATATVRKNGAIVTASFSAMVNTQINLNEAQKTGGALTYAKRQALMAVLGIDGGDHDDDGESSGARDNAKTVSEDQAIHLRDLCREAGKTEAFFLKAIRCSSFEDIPASKYKELVGQLEKWRDRR